RVDGVVLKRDIRPGGRDLCLDLRRCLKHASVSGPETLRALHTGWSAQPWDDRWQDNNNGSAGASTAWSAKYTQALRPGIGQLQQLRRSRQPAASDIVDRD